MYRRTRFKGSEFSESQREGSRNFRDSSAENSEALNGREKIILKSCVSKTVAPSNVALVCDWLTTPGGAEKVLLELHHMYPTAPIYTSQYSKKGITWFNDADVRTGWLQILPKFLRKFLGPLRQIYFSHLDLSSYDLVISVTGAEAKSVKASKHLCYCHVPTQYYWQMYDKYVENPGFGFLNPLVRLAFKLLVKPLRQADYKAAQLPDQFVTISNYAKDQIKKYYHRDAVVIAPPVDIAKFARNPQTFPPQSSEKSTENRELSTKSSEKSTSNPQVIHKNHASYPQESTTYPQLTHNLSTENTKFSTNFPQHHKSSPDLDSLHLSPSQYFIISCRQVTWKRVDLAIRACQQLGLPLLVVGDGPEHANLLRLAHDDPQIKFLPWVGADELATYLQGARGYIFPSLEPFGIAAVEALAAGCPVIAYREGGSRDFVIEGKNGLFFDHQTPESLAETSRSFQPLQFDPKIVAASATKFSPAHFREQISQLVTKLTKPEAPRPPVDLSPPSQPRNHRNQP